MIMRYWSADTLFAQLSNNYNMDVQYQRCTYGNSPTLSFLKVGGFGVLMNVQTHGLTHIHVYVGMYRQYSDNQNC